jgi:hypothetical protein
VSKFVYFDYRGTRLPTIHSSFREPYHFVVEVSETESGGQYRRLAELQKTAAILIRDAFDESFAEIVISAPERAEITPEDLNGCEHIESIYPASCLAEFTRFL